MTQSDRCPNCGAERSAGICPRCLIRLGLNGAALGLVPGEAPAESLDLDPRASDGSILRTLAATFGTVPRVLLRDTEPGAEAPVVRPSSPEMPPPDRSSRLHLLGEIARGGMGAVLKGRDTDLGRDLAVKVLLEAHKDRPDMVHRFVEEAQIAGQLQHPGIVPIYELGAFADRRPYFAMKLVKGRTLADVLATRSDPSLGRPRLLSTFLAVAQTVAYAHARGVIHRDLKPSNVMVGSFGEVQVMDWGLAKVLPKGGIVDDASAGMVPAHETVIATIRSASDSDADRSHAGSVMGTPAYMAPEQARGEVERLDERADVFALGSILCEVLTGQPAFTGRTAGAILRQAARGDLADARTRLDTCGADAELLALAGACLAAEPEDRPRDAGVVAERLSGYLGALQERMRQAELARAAESARAEEAVRRADVERDRRRLTLALAASLLALLTLGGGGSWWVVQDRQARRAQFDLALREVEVLRDQAAADPDGNLGRWRDARRALKAANDRLGSGAAPPAAARDRLTALTHQIEQGEAAVEADRRLVARLDEIRGTLDLNRGAEAEYARAFAAAGLDPDQLDPAEFGRRLSARPAAVARTTAEALDTWALIRGLIHANQQEGSKSAQRLVDAARAADPDPWRTALREALARRDREACRGLAREPACLAQGPAVQWLLATGLETLGERDLADQVLRAAVRCHPGDYWINSSLGNVLVGMRRNGPGANAGIVRGKGPEVAARAEPYMQASVALRPHFPEAHLMLGITLRHKGDIDGAIAEFRQALQLKPDFDLAHQELGITLRRKGDLDGAIVAFREAIRFGRPHNDLPFVGLGAALRAKGDVNGAVTAVREAIRMRPDFAAAHNFLSGVLLGKKDFDGAIAAAREAIRLDPNYANSYIHLGRSLRGKNDFDGAIVAYREAIRLEPGLAWAHHELGNGLRETGDLDGGIAEYREAIRLEPDLAYVHDSLGDTLRVKGDLDGAIAEYREKIRLQPNSPVTHTQLSSALNSSGDFDGAIAAASEAIRLNPNSAPAHIRLGAALRSKKDVDGAIVAYREALRLLPISAEAHSSLANALRDKGDLEESIAAAREAIRISPNFTNAHNSLALSLLAMKDLDASLAELHEAIRISPDHPDAHFNLGYTLRALGDFDGALAAFRRARELGGPSLEHRSPRIIADLARAERQARLAGRLPAFLRDAERPANPIEALNLADIARARNFHAASSRMAAEAFAAEPKLAEDPELRARYNAACSTALAASGKGKDDPPPNDHAKAKLRQQALDWLQAELAAHGRVLESGDTQASSRAAKNLRLWKSDPDLTDFRDPAALEKLPETERDEWRDFWAEVDGLLTKVVSGKP